MIKHTKESMKKEIGEKLRHHFSREPEEATQEHFFRAVALVMRDELSTRMGKMRSLIKDKQKRQVHYLSMEFLIGRSLYNNAYNLGVLDAVKEALLDYGVHFSDLCESEPDPGLGNGGLGRLSACYMDGLATQEVPASGYTIRYQHGVFKQRIVDGQQVELPDSWLWAGENFMIPQFHRTQEIRFGGTIDQTWENGRLKINHTGYTAVLAIPYDMPVSGYEANGVSVLRLWDAKSPMELDMTLFSRGEYLKALEQNALAEVISMVLYPEDNHPEGQSLRLKQQYFFVSATIQYITKKHKEVYGTLKNFAKKNAIQINDTHPALAVPELMRIFLDEEGMSWDEAWAIVTESLAYTNHTVMAEALERWPVALFEMLLPRITVIIKEINERFCRGLWEYYPGDFEKISCMAIVADNEIRMAHLAIAGSFSVNGVSALHSNILKETVFHDFYVVTPQKFTNVTNGVAHRRWLSEINPPLSNLITDLIGDDFLLRPLTLSRLSRFADDQRVLERLAVIKRENKVRLAEYIQRKNGVIVNPDSIFDAQAKRLHEYKRQLLNLMEIISCYLDLTDNPGMAFVPKTYLFAAKASPGYHMAKSIIRLIIGVAGRINNDPVVAGKMKVIFLEDYKVSLAEILIPATEISEQISTAGKEASGTGNMKFMMNGALTVGTMDGANVEMCEAAGEENMFIFGLRADETAELSKKYAYNPAEIYQQHEKIRRVLDFISGGVGDGADYKDIVTALTLKRDPYFLLADFDSYHAARIQAAETYLDPMKWNKMALLNIAASGRFAADRSVADYSRDIWKVPVKFPY